MWDSYHYDPLGGHPQHMLELEAFGITYEHIASLRNTQYWARL